MLVAAVSFGENFPNDFQAALKLVNEGKIIEAEEAFLKLAGQKAGKRATDESMAQAAYAPMRKAEARAGRKMAHVNRIPVLFVHCDGQDDARALLAA